MGGAGSAGASACLAERERRVGCAAGARAGTRAPSLMLLDGHAVVGGMADASTATRAAPSVRLVRRRELAGRMGAGAHAWCRGRLAVVSAKKDG